METLWILTFCLFPTYPGTEVYDCEDEPIPYTSYTKCVQSQMLYPSKHPDENYYTKCKPHKNPPIRT